MSKSFIRILNLVNEIEASKLDSILDDECIPHEIHSNKDTAYDGVYQISLGWGYLLGYSEDELRIKDIYKNYIEKKEDITHNSIRKRKTFSIFDIGSIVVVFTLLFLCILFASLYFKSKKVVDYIYSNSTYKYEWLSQKSLSIISKIVDKRSYTKEDENNDGYFEKTTQYDYINPEYYIEQYDNNKDGVIEKYTQYIKNSKGKPLSICEGFDENNNSVYEKLIITFDNGVIYIYHDKNEDHILDYYEIKNSKRGYTKLDMINESFE